MKVPSKKEDSMEMSTEVQAEAQVMVNVINGGDTTLEASDLYSGANQILFQVAQELKINGTKPDLVTITHALEKGNKLHEAGGKEYVHDLFEFGNQVDNLEPYEEIVREASTRRSVIRYAHNLISMAKEGAKTPDLLVKAQTEPMGIGTNRRTDATILVQDEVFDVIDEIDDRRRGVQSKGVKTGFDELDKITNGLQPSDLIIVAGRPSMGKTALGGQIATNVSKTQGTVFIGSLEMDKSSLIERMLSSESRVSSTAMRAGRVSDNDLEKLRGMAERFQDYHPILINDTPRMSATELRIEMSKQNARHGLKLAVIDYLGLLKEDKPGQQRYKEVGDSVKILRAAARELEIPVLLLCQLNRSCEHREDKRPNLSDLRESGDIEQDSDVVIMVYRHEYYCRDCKDKFCHNGEAELLVRKQRKGPTNTANLVWHEDFTRFDNRFYQQEFGGGYEPEEKSGEVPPPQGVNNTEENQPTLGFRTADGAVKSFPNPAKGDVDPPF
jgi:replicative DNA helicase